MHSFRSLWMLIFEICLLSWIPSTLGLTDLTGGDHCFCKLKGQIGDCSCNVDTVDYFNNKKIYPRLHSLLQKDYFRFYKVNLNKECPFWADDSRCAMRFCHVKPCREDEIPPGLKADQKHDFHDGEDMHIKYLERSQDPDSDCQSDVDDELGYLNTTISAESYEEFALWQAHDDAQDNFCTLSDEDEKAEYVDLSINPERYTGYRGPSAHRVWSSIYKENCFIYSSYKRAVFLTDLSPIPRLSVHPETYEPKNNVEPYFPSSKLSDLCLEKRVFYRVISGLHASINIHLCSQFLFPDTLGSLTSRGDGGRWGPNLVEFKRRFDPELTNGEGAHWLRNLYFLYLLEVRAVAKAAPYLVSLEYYTGREREDRDTQANIKDLLTVISSFPDHFNESTMFNGGSQAYKLKEDFKQHFRNISRIMDCVGCEKCKLWGKLQTQGLGTALKILFSGKFDEKTIGNAANRWNHNGKFKLERSEIVSLFNALGRLSTSIYEIENFREMMR